ncbi:GtrA family protein [Kineothrix alysoides]|nr:GtrA family protein [Kineothrix alysoides]
MSIIYICKRDLADKEELLSSFEKERPDTVMEDGLKNLRIGLRSIMDIKKLFEEVLHFGIIGVINTLLGFFLIMVFYNVLHLNYWVASATSYVIGSVFSYFANKKLTFKVQENSREYVIKFALNIAICYLLAYGVARPLVRSVLSEYSQTIIENVAIVMGTGIFIVLNFIGQKFFVFKGKDKNIVSSQNGMESK